VQADNYISAMVCNPPKILGVQLLPFSFGHTIILSGNKSPFVSHTEAGEPTLLDILFFLFVCGQTFKDYNNCIDAPLNWWDKLAITRWVVKQMIRFYIFFWIPLTRPVFFHKWENEFNGFCTGVIQHIKKQKIIGLQETSIKIPHYIEQYSKTPYYEFINTKYNKHTPSLPNGNWIQSVTNILKADMNYTEEKVMNAPLTVCLYDFYQKAAREGQIRLFTPDEEANYELFLRYDKAGRASEFKEYNVMKARGQVMDIEDYHIQKGTQCA
jgi:hypothetical protein